MVNNSETETQEAEQQSLGGAITDGVLSPDEREPPDASFESAVTAYLLRPTHREFNENLPDELMIRDPRFADYNKQTLHTAGINVAMQYPEEVAEVARENHKRLVEKLANELDIDVDSADELDPETEKNNIIPDADWKPLSLYVPTETKAKEFNKIFFARLRNGYDGLRKADGFLKRELKQAAIEVALNHREKYVDEADAVHEYYE